MRPFLNQVPQQHIIPHKIPQFYRPTLASNYFPYRANNPQSQSMYNSNSNIFQKHSFALPQPNLPQSNLNRPNFSYSPQNNSTKQNITQNNLQFNRTIDTTKSSITINNQNFRISNTNGNQLSQDTQLGRYDDIYACL